MVKGCFNTALALLIASLFDKYLSDGRHIESALAILRQIRHALGV